MSARRVVLAIAVVTAATAASAQEPAPCTIAGPLAETACALRAEKSEDRDLRPDALFFEPSKVLFIPHLFQSGPNSETGRQDRLAIEVEFAEPIFPYQKRTSPVGRQFGGRTFAVAFTPMYRVRIWKEHSAPVRVPSFMPKATVQMNFLDRRAPGRQWGGGGNAENARGFVGLTSAMVTAGHHSNGQDGCLYADEDGRELDPCPEEPGAVRINRLNGSFSTNYVQATVIRAWYRVPDVSDVDARNRARPGVWTDERFASYALFGGLTYEFNIPVDSFGGPIEEAARPIYGMNRFRLMAGVERFPRGVRELPRFKLAAWAQLTDKKADSADCGVSGRTDSFGDACAPRFGWGADLSVGLGSAVDFLGAYARYFHGQDYYNLSFTHRKGNSFQAGLSFTPGRSRGPAFPTLTRRVLEEEAEYERRGCFDEYRDALRAQVKEGGTLTVSCP
jgi:hypothetical protein